MVCGAACRFGLRPWRGQNPLTGTESAHPARDRPGPGTVTAAADGTMPERVGAHSAMRFRTLLPGTGPSLTA